MSDGDIAIGVVGAGRIAQLIHLPVLAGIDGVHVVAVAEPDADARAAAGALAPGARLYADLKDILAATTVDALVVSAPTAVHAGIAQTAFAAGRSVYLEKPIAATLADGRAVIEAWRAAGTIGMTGFMLRFSPAFTEARALVAAGAIGDVVAAQSVFTAPPAHAPEWKGRRATGGGALLDLLSHHADAVRWLLATEVLSAAAQLRSMRTEEDTATVQMKTALGVTVQALVSTSAAEDHRFEIVGSAGRLAVDPWRMAAPERFGLAGGAGRRDRLRRLTPSRLLHRPDYRGPFRGALAAFVAAVRAGRPVGPDLADGLASLAVVEAAQRAADSGADEAVEATGVAWRRSFETEAEMIRPCAGGAPRASRGRR
jgi:myo-inositol 2-dehydrogenase/D-chiro-inositol 1-dehydrogenase